MRCTSINRIWLLTLALMVLVILPARLMADSDDTYTTDDGAVVRVLVKNGKTYIAVKSGSITLRYPDGKVMAVIPAGSAMMLSNLRGTLDFGPNGLQMTRRQPTRLTIALSSASSPISIKTDSKPQISKTMRPGMQVIAYAKELGRISKKDKKRVKAKLFKKAMDISDTATDRTLLSLTQ